jgi:prepilin-type N-terminal cleavage/methylation domain-containing protein
MRSDMLFRKSGFTLVELLVVIAIIGILVGALSFQMTHAGDAAKSMRCKANIKNLTQAVLSYAVESEWLPAAGSYRYPDHMYDSTRGYRVCYYEVKGWVGWTDMPQSLESPESGRTANCQASSSSWADAARQSLTNGALWNLVGRDEGTYCCESMKKLARGNGVRYLKRSYMMNCFFGYDCKSETGARVAGFQRREMSSLSSKGNAGSRLVFAEIPFYKPGTHAVNPQVGYNSGTPCWADSVLEAQIDQYPKARREYIGFNHVTANHYVAHVSFADGHVDILAEPKNASESDLMDLTESLCNGEEIDETIRKKMR